MSAQLHSTAAGQRPVLSERHQQIQTWRGPHASPCPLCRTPHCIAAAAPALHAPHTAPRRTCVSALHHMTTSSPFPRHCTSQNLRFRTASHESKKLSTHIHASHAAPRRTRVFHTASHDSRNLRKNIHAPHTAPRRTCVSVLHHMRAGTSARIYMLPIPHLAGLAFPHCIRADERECTGNLLRCRTDPEADLQCLIRRLQNPHARPPAY